MANVLLSAKGIKIRFGGVIAADGIDLDVHEGENLAIIGPNGAGKTTFLNISTGYLRPQAGSVTFLGYDITSQLPRTITKLGIARAFQIPQLFLDQTVMENMLIAAASLKGHPSGFKTLASMPAPHDTLASRHLRDSKNNSYNPTANGNVLDRIRRKKESHHGCAVFALARRTPKRNRAQAIRIVFQIRICSQSMGPGCIAG